MSAVRYLLSAHVVSSCSKKAWNRARTRHPEFMRRLSGFVQALCLVFGLTASNVDAASCTSGGLAFECAPVKFGWFTPDTRGPMAVHNWWGPVWQTGSEACIARHEGMNGNGYVYSGCGLENTVPYDSTHALGECACNRVEISTGAVVRRTLLSSPFGPYCQNPQPNPWEGYPPPHLLVDDLGNLACASPAVASDVLIISGQSETRPKGTAGATAVALTAKVSSGTTPKVGVPISFSVEVTPNSGGHDHHDINRPKAKLSAVQGTTDANGEVRLTFTAPEAAGIHTVRATCASCSNSPAVKEIKVKVPDLIQIPADTQTPPRYVLVGQRPEHRKSHFVTEAGLDALNQVIRVFARLGWGQVGINDASLEWGGMFDIEGKWLKPYMNNKGKWVTGGHAEHRNGEQVDISFARPASVSMQLRKKAYREVCNNNRTSLSPDILWHENDGYAPHFHIYLTGKVGAPAAGKNNQCTEK